MYDEAFDSATLREVRLTDVRLALLPDAESRFRAASRLIEFFAKKTGAYIISWCVEQDDLVALVEGGDLSETPAPRQVTARRKRELLAAAADELSRAIEYRRAAESTDDDYASLGYLDLSREAHAAALALAHEAGRAD
jgi:hypothetical protein